MLINGTQITTFDAHPSRRSGFRSIPAHEQNVVTAPGAFRGVFVGREGPTTEPLFISGFLSNTTVALLQTDMDRLKFELRPQRQLQIEFSDRANVEYIGYARRVSIDDIVPGWISKAAFFELELIVADPTRRDTSVQNDTTSGSAPLVLTPTVGIALMPVTITIVGNTAIPLVDPVINYRNGADAVLFTLSYTGTLTGTDTLIINTETFGATLNAADARANLTGNFFDIDPGDGDFLGSPTGPDVQLTATSGDCDQFDLDYRRRYW